MEGKPIWPHFFPAQRAYHGVLAAGSLNFSDALPTIAA
jgi:hypothetical protein